MKAPEPSTPGPLSGIKAMLSGEVSPVTIFWKLNTGVVELVTLNELEYVLPLLSEITIGCRPTEAVDGTVNEPWASPSTVVVRGEGVVTTGLPSKVIVIVELLANPLG